MTSASVDSSSSIFTPTAGFGLLHSVNDFYFCTHLNIVRPYAGLLLCYFGLLDNHFFFFFFFDFAALSFTMLSTTICKSWLSSITYVTSKTDFIDEGSIYDCSASFEVLAIIMSKNKLNRSVKKS